MMSVLRGRRNCIDVVQLEISGERKSNMTIDPDQNDFTIRLSLKWIA